MNWSGLSDGSDLVAEKNWLIWTGMEFSMSYNVHIRVNQLWHDSQFLSRFCYSAKANKVEPNLHVRLNKQWFHWRKWQFLIVNMVIKWESGLEKLVNVNCFFLLMYHIQFGSKCFYFSSSYHKICSELWAIFAI